MTNRYSCTKLSIRVAWLPLLVTPASANAYRREKMMTYIEDFPPQVQKSTVLDLLE